MKQFPSNNSKVDIPFTHRTGIAALIQHFPAVIFGIAIASILIVKDAIVAVWSVFPVIVFALVMFYGLFWLTTIIERAITNKDIEKSTASLFGLILACFISIVGFVGLVTSWVGGHPGPAPVPVRTSCGNSGIRPDGIKQSKSTYYRDERMSTTIICNDGFVINS